VRQDELEPDQERSRERREPQGRAPSWEESACQRPERDERGRLLPGHTANPRGRREAGAYAKLLAAAERVGAQIVVMVPPKVANAAPPPPEAA
jgi:hypothetical protein